MGDYMHRKLLCEIRKYFLSGDSDNRTIAILTLLDLGYSEDDGYKLMHAFDDTLNPDSWYLLVRDSKILDGIRRRPRLGESPSLSGLITRL